VFMRGKARRNKNDSFERESLQSDARQNQVGMMHRIESAAVNADLLQFNKEGIGCARPCTAPRLPSSSQRFQRVRPFLCHHVRAPGWKARRDCNSFAATCERVL